MSAARQTPRSKRAPCFYFSFRSPYSWLAHWELTRHHAELAGRLDWVPFWEPDETSERMLHEAGGSFVYTPMSRAKHFYILQDVRRQAAARDLQVTWPVDRSPWWEVSHLAYFAAADRGCGRQFVEAVYRARWLEGRDISDRATMAEIAGELGLEAEALAGAVDDDALRVRGLETLLAIEADGVFGVPFFVSGFHKFWGVERLGQFVALLERPDGSPAPATEADAVVATPGRTSDGGHAGGCG